VIGVTNVVVGAVEYQGSIVCGIGFDSIRGHTTRNKVNPIVTMIIMYFFIKIFSLGLPL